MESHDDPNDLAQLVQHGFQMLQARMGLLAVQFFYAAHQKSAGQFAQAFRSQSEANEARIPWDVQRAVLTQGLQAFDETFPALLTQLVAPRSQTGTPAQPSTQASASMLIGVLDQLGAGGGMASPKLLESMLALSATLPEPARAQSLPALLKALVRSGLAMQFEQQVEQLMHGFTAACAATAWMGFITCAGPLVKPQHGQWAVDAFVHSQPDELALPALVATALGTFSCAQLFTLPQQQMLIKALLRCEAWPSLVRLFDTCCARTLCDFLLDFGDQKLWETLMRTPGFARGYTRELLRCGRVQVVSAIVSRFIDVRERSEVAILGVAQGMLEGLHRNDDDWRQLITLVISLDTAGATAGCETLVTCLRQLGMLSELHIAHLMQAADGWDPLPRLRYLLSLIRGQSGHVAPQLWAAAVDAARQIPLDAIAPHLAHTAFTQSSTWAPAPDEIAMALLDMLAASGSPDWPGVLTFFDDMPCACVLHWLAVPGHDAARAALLHDKRAAAKLVRQCLRLAPGLLDKLLDGVQLPPQQVVDLARVLGACSAEFPQLQTAIAAALKSWAKHLPPDGAKEVGNIADRVVRLAAHMPSTAASSPHDSVVPGFNVSAVSLQACLDLLSRAQWWPPVKPGGQVTKPGTPDHDAQMAASAMLKAYASMPDSADLYQAALVNVATAHSLQLASIAPVAAYRKHLETTYPHLNWSLVWHGNAALKADDPVRKHAPSVMTSALSTLLDRWIMAVLEAATSLWVQSQPHPDRRKAVVDALAPHLKPLLLALVPDTPDLEDIDASQIDALVESLVMRDGLPDYDSYVLDRLFVSGSLTMEPAIAGHVQALLKAGGELLHGAESACVARLAQATGELQAKLKQLDVKEAPPAFETYSFEVLDKDNPECLLIDPKKLRTDLSPSKAQGAMLIECLVGPCLLVGVRDRSGDLVALARCFLCGSPTDLVCDWIDLNPQWIEYTRHRFGPYQEQRLSATGWDIFIDLVQFLITVKDRIGAQRLMVAGAIVSHGGWFLYPQAKYDNGDLTYEVLGERKLHLQSALWRLANKASRNSAEFVRYYDPQDISRDKIPPF